VTKETPLQPRSRFLSFFGSFSIFFCLSAILAGATAMAHVPSSPGRIAGVWVPSADLVDLIDPGGHTLRPEGISCLDCLTALVSDGYCRACRIGYVDGLAYMSRLSYLLARQEERFDPRTSSCAVCLTHVLDPVWCDGCERGVLGAHSVRNRDEFDELVRERQRLVEAVRILPRCDLCALAYFIKDRCPRCRISYDDRLDRAVFSK
jgi:hypothetical protein